MPPRSPGARGFVDPVHHPLLCLLVGAIGAETLGPLRTSWRDIRLTLGVYSADSITWLVIPMPNSSGPLCHALRRPTRMAVCPALERSRILAISVMAVLERACKVRVSRPPDAFTGSAVLRYDGSRRHLARQLSQSCSYHEADGAARSCPTNA